MAEIATPWFLPVDKTRIELIELEDGALKLHLRGREQARAASSAHDREQARIIAVAWGDRYLADLLAVTIPAAMAPGNIPAFAEHFDCEFVIVTEMRLFERIANAAVTQQLLAHCDLRLVPLDDLLSPWYGITLTYALIRGFADLGEAMTRTHLVFLNADFILADGCYRTLAKKIREGERLVVSPSYCMVLEQTLEPLRSYYDGQSSALTISPRALAALIIENRHNTIRAKTVNQRLFRIHRYDQFYWYVDDRTLLARQMPIAVVYMRPQRALTDMPTFWDYGVISEYCPGLSPCVLGDSDDFLMGELRASSTFSELLHLGWRSVDEIAADLSSFTTKDHHDYGRYLLTLHSGDLPPQIEAELAQFRAFVDEVDSRLSPPIDYRTHPFWVKDFPIFSEMIAEGRRKMQHALRAGLALRDAPQSAVQFDRLGAEMAQTSTRRLSIEAARAHATCEIRAQIHELESRYAERKHDLERKFDGAQREADAALETAHRRYAELERRREALLAQLQGSISGGRNRPEIFGIEFAADDVAAASGGDGEAARGRENAEAVQPARWSPRQSVKRWVGGLAPLYRSLFGQLPRTTPWHPYHELLQPVLRAILSTQGRVSNVLVIGTTDSLAPLLARPLGVSAVEIAPHVGRADVYQEILGGRRFDLCVCDLGFNDLLGLRALLVNIRQYMAPGGKIVVFHRNVADANLDQWAFSLAESCFPLFGRSRIVFTGTLLTSVATRWFYRALSRHNVFHLRGLVVYTMALAVCAPLARLGTWFERRRDPQQLPRHCTGMTIEINLVP